MHDRLYSPDDIRRILERAARLQQDASEVNTAAGLTLSELQDAASSSGIDPAFIQQAAFEIGLPDGAEASTTSTHIHVERLVPGVLSDENWGAALLELRRRFQVDGEDSEEIIESLGTTRSWRYVEDEEVKTQVYITPRPGVLHIKMSQKIAWTDRLISSLIWALVAALGFGSIIANQGDGTLFSALSYVSTFLLSFLAAFGIDTNRRKSRMRDFNMLADSVSRTISSEQGLAAARPGEAEVALDAAIPAMDLDAPPADDTSPGRNRDRARSR